MVVLGGRKFGPVFLHTQPFLYRKHLQYTIIINTNIIVAIIGVPIVENNLTSMDDQKVGSNDLILVKVLFMLNRDMYFISGILLAMPFKLPSVRLYMSRDCIKLKLFIFEYDLLKPKLSSIASMMESTFSQLLHGRTKVIAFALHLSSR